MFEQEPAGFFLVEDPTGAVTIVDAKLDRSLTSADPDYETYLESAKTQLDTYFNTLKVQASSDVLSGSNIYDIRRQLGAMSVRKARKTTRQSFQQGS